MKEEIKEHFTCRKNPFVVAFFSSPFMAAVFGILLYIKIFTPHGATLSWGWVLAPFWIPWVFVIGFFLAWYLIAGICFLIGYSLIGLAELVQWIRKIFRKENR